MISPKAKRNISRIIPFGLIWLFLGWIFLFIEMAAIGDEGHAPSTAIRLDLRVFVFASVAVTIVGLIIGSIELLWLHRVFARKSFAKKILYKLIIYSILLSVIMLVAFAIAAAIEFRTGIFDPRVWNKYRAFLASYTHLSTALQMTLSLIVSLLYTEIGDNIGHAVLINFFTGKYHEPVEEERIFMFLDMKSSTTIAEELGNAKYFRLLKAYYADISNAIIEHAGEIYQYVGDEIIVSWKTAPGLQNNNCIRCFFAMKHDLETRSRWYLEKFGVVPGFKAGIHYGKVTTGEIGVVKKDIFFTGDVLNAASRIQGLCNTYATDVLISGELADRLQPDDRFRISAMGETKLRGRAESMMLYTVS